MRSKDAASVAARLGSAFRLDEDRVHMLADELAKTSACSACVASAVNHIIRDVGRIPQNPIPMVLGMIRSTSDSEHAKHIADETESDSKVALQETWWRTVAVPLILKHVAGNQTLASFIAARMWQTQAIGESEENVTEELHRYPHIWVKASTESLREHSGGRPEAYTERAWTFAREVSKQDPKLWSDTKFKALAV